MKAQVTEAHLSTASKIIGRVMLGTYTTSTLAQLIADSEARALNEHAEVARGVAHHNVDLRLENDQLRAEVERLTVNNGQLRESYVYHEARAEKAEASLHALRLVCGTDDANKFETWCDKANARANKAEAELAKERARTDYLISHLANWWPTRDSIDAAMEVSI